MMRGLLRLRRGKRSSRGAVFVEYLLLMTIVGIGVICGLAVLKDALIHELTDLATAITNITCP